MKRGIGLWTLRQWTKVKESLYLTHLLVPLHYTNIEMKRVHVCVPLKMRINSKDCQKLHLVTNSTNWFPEKDIREQTHTYSYIKRGDRGDKVCECVQGDSPGIKRQDRGLGAGSVDTAWGIEANVSSHQSVQREKQGHWQTERPSAGMGAGVRG